MARYLLTGAAGFIGSHLAERLVAEGYDVLGVDCFTDYYARAAKEGNLSRLRESSRFRLLEEDILELDWAPLLDKAEYLFHEAAQPGVREREYYRLNGHKSNFSLAERPVFL